MRQLFRTPLAALHDIFGHCFHRSVLNSSILALADHYSIESTNNWKNNFLVCVSSFCFVCWSNHCLFIVFFWSIHHHKWRAVWKRNDELPVWHTVYMSFSASPCVNTYITRVWVLSIDSYPQLDVHESVRRYIIMNTINEVQLYRLIYYS